MILGKNLETILSAVRDGISRLVNGKQCVGSQTVDILSASVATLTVPAGANEAWITVEKPTYAVTDSYFTPLLRWSVNSTAPVTGAATTSTHGMVMAAGSPVLILKGADAILAFKAIAIAATTTGNLMLKVTYFK